MYFIITKITELDINRTLRYLCHQYKYCISLNQRTITGLCNLKYISIVGEQIIWTFKMLSQRPMVKTLLNKQFCALNILRFSVFGKHVFSLTWPFKQSMDLHDYIQSSMRYCDSAWNCLHTLKSLHAPVTKDPN